jgi:hypothetical protein
MRTLMLRPDACREAGLSAKCPSGEDGKPLVGVAADYSTGKSLTREGAWLRFKYRGGGFERRPDRRRRVSSERF